MLPAPLLLALTLAPADDPSPPGGVPPFRETKKK
jgi:hypothetical protein